MAGRHPPQTEPAPQVRATESSSWAPSAIAAQMLRSVTARHWQMYMVSSKATLTHRRRGAEPWLPAGVEWVTSKRS